jgi:GH18 family chitinase
VNRRQLTLGLAFYGRGWQGVAPRPNSDASGTLMSAVSGGL